MCSSKDRRDIVKRNISSDAKRVIFETGTYRPKTTLMSDHSSRKKLDMHLPLKDTIF